MADDPEDVEDVGVEDVPHHGGVQALHVGVGGFGHGALCGEGELLDIRPAEAVQGEVPGDLDEDLHQQIAGEKADAQGQDGVIIAPGDLVDILPQSPGDEGVHGGDDQDQGHGGEKLPREPPDRLFEIAQDEVHGGTSL